MEVTTLQELLEGIDRSRSEDETTIHICRDGRKYPSMTVYIRDEKAYAYFFPNEECAGHHSLNNEEVTEEMVLISVSDDIHVPNYSLISVKDAELAAREFLQHGGLPRAIEWFEL